MATDPPAVETDVTLTLPDREMLPGRVDVSADGVLEIAVLASPRTPIAVLESSRMFCEYVIGDGVYRLVGAMKALGRAPRHTDQFGVYDMVRFTSSAPPMLLMRREFIRAAYTAKIDIVPARVNGIAAECATVDVSGGGLLVRGLSDVTVGDVVEFVLAPLDGAALPIHGRGMVVRCLPTGDVGLRFTSIDEVDRDRLVTFAYQRELVERAGRLAA